MTDLAAFSHREVESQKLFGDLAFKDIKKVKRRWGMSLEEIDLN